MDILDDARRVQLIQDKVPMALMAAGRELATESRIQLAAMIARTLESGAASEELTRNFFQASVTEPLEKLLFDKGKGLEGMGIATRLQRAISDVNSDSSRMSKDIREILEAGVTLSANAQEAAKEFPRVPAVNPQLQASDAIKARAAILNKYVEKLRSGISAFLEINDVNGSRRAR